MLGLILFLILFLGIESVQKAYKLYHILTNKTKKNPPEAGLALMVMPDGFFNRVAVGIVILGI